MKKFSTRLIALMESLEVSGYMLAKEIEVSDMSISKYRTGKSLPACEFFEKLSARYPEVNLNWLIGERGEMFLDPNMKVKPAKVKEPPKDLIEAKNELISLQTKNIDFLETRMEELRDELRTYKKAEEILQAVKKKKSKNL
jgi:transcriptional regulator with XRE-family HTH domain